MNLQFLGSVVRSLLLDRTIESCSLYHPFYRSHESVSSTSHCLFLEALTFMVVHGCALDVKGTNTSDWAAALAATSKT